MQQPEQLRYVHYRPCPLPQASPRLAVSRASRRISDVTRHCCWRLLSHGMVVALFTVSLPRISAVEVQVIRAVRRTA